MNLFNIFMVLFRDQTWNADNIYKFKNFSFFVNKTNGVIASL